MHLRAWVGLAGAGRVSERAGAALGLGLVLLAPVAIRLAESTGNVLPWACLQFGGLALVVGMALLRPRHRALDIRWGLVIAIYAIAKVLEMHDHDLFHASAGWISGHTLKHVVAALAAWPVISAIGSRTESGQNATGMRTTASVADRRMIAQEESL